MQFGKTLDDDYKLKVIEDTEKLLELSFSLLT